MAGQSPGDCEYGSFWHEGENNPGDCEYGYFAHIGAVVVPDEPVVPLADVLLGPSGVETPLPSVKFIGSPPAWPISTNKRLEKAQMSDGSYRWAFFGTKKVFEIGFGYLTDAQLTILKNLNALNQILRYKNKHEEDVWYDVIISSFSHEPERVDLRNSVCGGCRLDKYITRMTLEET